MYSHQTDIIIYNRYYIRIYNLEINLLLRLYVDRLIPYFVFNKHL